MALAQWQSAPSLPAPRAGHTLTAAGHMLYVIGGKNKDDYAVNMDIFDASTGKWQQPVALPFQKRWYHTATVVQGCIYVVGGSHGEQYLGDVWRFDIRQRAWQEVEVGGAAHLLRRSGAAAARSLKDKDVIVLHGGVGPSVEDSSKVSMLSTMVQFDTGRKSAKLLQPRGRQRVPEARVYHSLTAMPGHQLVLYGGRNFVTKKCVSEGEQFAVFNLVSRQWSFPESTGPLPQDRSSHRAVSWGDHMLLFGGHSEDKQRHNDLLALRQQPPGDQWVWSRSFNPAIGTRPSGRASGAVALLGSDLYLVAGYARNNTFLSDAWLLHLGGEDHEPALDFGSERQEGSWRRTKRKRDDADSQARSELLESGHDAATAATPAVRRRSVAAAAAAMAPATAQREDQRLHSREAEAAKDRQTSMRLQAELAEKERKAEAAAAENKRLHEELAEVSAREQVAVRSKQQLQQQVSRRDLETEREQRELVDARTQLQAAAADRAGLERQVQELAAERDELGKQCQEQEKQLRDGRQQASEREEQLGKEIAALRENLQRMQAQGQQAVAERNQAVQELASFRERSVVQLKEQQMRLDKAENDGLAARRAHQEAQRQLEARVEDQRRQLDSISADLKAVTKEQASAQNEVNSLRNALKDSQARVDDMHPRMVTAENKVLSLEAEMNSRNHDLKMLKKHELEDALCGERQLAAMRESMQILEQRLADKRRRGAQ